MVFLTTLIGLLLLLPAQQTTGTIEASVVDSATGAPLAETELALGRTGRPTQRVRSNEKGIFVFTDLEPGRYTILAKRAGYLSQAYGNPPESEYRNAIGEFPVAAGQTLRASIPMLKAATLSGRIFQTNREPAANARVGLGVLQKRPFGPSFLRSSQGIDDPNTISVLTNDRGEYRMTGVPPGEYYVSASPGANTATGLRVNNAAITYYPGVHNPDQAVTVKVAAGADVTAIDFSLEPVSTLKVSGRIVNPLLSGGQEGRDYLYRFNLIPRVARIIQQPGSATSELPDLAPAIDEFELRNIAPGEYELFVAFRAGPIDPRGNDTYYMGRSVVAVTDRDVTQLVTTIEPGVDINGQFVLDDSAKALVPDVRTLSLFFQSADNLPQSFSPGSRGVTVQQDGSFVLPHAITGHYLLFPGLNPRLNLYLAAARYGPRDILGQIFEVDANTAGPLILEVSGLGGKMTGRVTNRDNQPVARAQVILVPPTSPIPNIVDSRSAATDADGNFTIVGIRPGTYTAYAFTRIDQNAWTDPQFMAPYATSGVSVTIGGNSQLQRDLKVIPAR